MEPADAPKGVLRPLLGQHLLGFLADVDAAPRLGLGRRPLALDVPEVEALPACD
jgi:hypothetical protein